MADALNPWTRSLKRPWFIYFKSEKSQEFVNVYLSAARSGGWEGTYWGPRGVGRKGWENSEVEGKVVGCELVEGNAIAGGNSRTFFFWLAVRSGFHWNLQPTTAVIACMIYRGKQQADNSCFLRLVYLPCCYQIIEVWLTKIRHWWVIPPVI